MIQSKCLQIRVRTETKTCNSTIDPGQGTLDGHAINYSCIGQHLCTSVHVCTRLQRPQTRILVFSCVIAPVF